MSENQKTIEKTEKTKETEQIEKIEEIDRTVNKTDWPLHVHAYSVHHFDHDKKKGKFILANYDEDSIIVYQAFKPSIGKYAIKNQTFKGCPDYSYTRMTWIKTEYLWMNHRSGWSTKKNQEITLALRVSHEGFLKILSLAFPGHFYATSTRFENEEQFRKLLKESRNNPSQVRLQWDPAWSVTDNKIGTRRAIQLGLKGEIAKEFIEDYVTEIINITPLVHHGLNNFVKSKDSKLTPVPVEKEFIVSEEIQKIICMI
ncbi:hypothetical protein M0813_08827 [Anaeramoeba flamelloides]|uniref:Uncharacterized protein n=1 Tax=Anaeramoeba flamelloides TaxID=1746091 RepID=A0AAV7YWN6_9EUKA|nr:hypothetical protein M0812_22174 [Anaeramoeba flamelloides]KAJ6228476.1 hypothetical protein M0813_08827 [Anaeramoeba flamelloides]